MRFVYADPPHDLRGRLYSRVVPAVDSECLLWTGPTEKFGYGRMTSDRKILYVHRLAWELEVGPIPDGYVVDHLCRVPNCVNIAHLEPVTPTENARRSNFAVPRGGQANSAKTHCPAGHPYAGENLIINKTPGDRHKNGSRKCRICRNASMRRRTSEVAMSP